ncbi:hypothetical protein [Bradyrhizobium centrosematis]|uniref:hypothetical protein n=1 Tax=Bradyrhizobium centrosematis TaxID=1300039 RepID=UPI003890DF4D
MRCFADRPHLTFLDSASSSELWGRHSYLACDRFSTYTVAEKRVSCNKEVLEGNPWEVLRAVLAKYPQKHRSGLPPFQGGAAGFWAYDLNRTLELLPIPSNHRSIFARFHAALVRSRQLRSQSVEMLGCFYRLAGARLDAYVAPTRWYRCLPAQLRRRKTLWVELAWHSNFSRQRLYRGDKPRD